MRRTARLRLGHRQLVAREDVGPELIDTSTNHQLYNSTTSQSSCRCTAEKMQGTARIEESQIEGAVSAESKPQREALDATTNPWLRLPPAELSKLPRSRALVPTKRLSDGFDRMWGRVPLVRCHSADPRLLVAFDGFHKAATGRDTASLRRRTRLIIHRHAGDRPGKNIKGHLFATRHETPIWSTRRPA